MNLKAYQIATFVSFSCIEVNLSEQLHKDICLSLAEAKYKDYESKIGTFEKQTKIIKVQLIILGVIGLIGLTVGWKFQSPIGLIVACACWLVSCLRIMNKPIKPSNVLGLYSSPTLTAADFETWEESPGKNIAHLIHQLIGRHNDVVADLSIRLKQNSGSIHEKVLESLITNALELQEQATWLTSVLKWYDEVQQKYVQLTHEFTQLSGFFWAGEKTLAILGELKKEASFPAPKSDFIDHTIMLSNSQQHRT